MRSCRAVVVAVARDTSRVVLTSDTWKFPRADSMICVELFAIWVSAEFAIFLHPNEIVIESDSTFAIEEINKGNHSTCLLCGGLVFDIIGLSGLLKSCKFLYTCWETNILTHPLSK